MVSGLATPLASNHGRLLPLHLGNSEWRGLCWLVFTKQQPSGLKLTFSFCLVIQQQGYLDVEHANLDSLKGGQVQQVPEHSKSAPVLLMSVWAPGVDRCAYPIPSYQEGRKINAFIFAARPENDCPDRRCAFYLGMFLKNPPSSVNEEVSPQ